MIGYRTALLLTIVTIVASVTAVGLDSEADPSAIDQWYEYGYEFTVNDENYNPATYTSIEWRYSRSPDGLDTATPMTDPELRVTLNQADYPLWGVYPIFVRENAVVDGVAKQTELVVNVNPIDTSCYVLFMYDDTTGYRYAQFTVRTVIAGDGRYFAEPPADPGREGYIFGGWFMDRECTVPYTAGTPITFSETVQEVRIYPKWTVDPHGTVPGPSEVHSVAVRPVPGLDIEPAGMLARNGADFRIDVTVTDGFRFDLSGLKAVTDGGRTLEHSVSGDTHSFTLRSVDRDTVVFLSGFVQYYRVVLDLKDVTTVGVQEWVRHGTSLELPLKTTDGGSPVAAVYMSNKEITGSAFSGGTVRISEVTGDVIVHAHSEQSETFTIPLWVWIAIGCLVAALAIAVIAYRRKDR